MSNIKVNFIIPSWSYWAEPLRAQPLTQLYLATILEEQGLCEIEFTDFRDGPKEVNEADIYFYTVCSPDIKEVKQIVDSIRLKYPNSKHIAGGPHPTICKRQDCFDGIVIGRGEEAIRMIVEDYPNIRKRYKIFSKINYPFPKRSFLDIDKIINDGLFKSDNIRSTTAQFSFGCPFNCSFCANYERGPIIRNSLKKISDEIDYLKRDYGIKGLSLQDEICIPLDKHKAIEFLTMIHRKKIKWRGQVRAKMDRYILQLAYQSGLVELSFGLESVNQEVLDLTGKGIKLYDVEETIKNCKEIGIKTRIYLLNGLPGENKHIVEETKKFINENNPDLVLLSSLQPYPGSPIAQDPKKFGIKWVSKDFHKFNHLLCRFEDSDDDPENAVPYEYFEGKGLTRKQIMNNLLELQKFLREREMNK